MVRLDLSTLLVKRDKTMKHVIAIWQTYQHEDGDEYEVVRADKDSVVFETSRGSVVCMDVDELISELNESALLPVVDHLDDDVEEVGDEDEDVED